MAAKKQVSGAKAQAVRDQVAAEAKAADKAARKRRQAAARTAGTEQETVLVSFRTNNITTQVVLVGDGKVAIRKMGRRSEMPVCHALAQFNKGQARVIRKALFAVGQVAMARAPRIDLNGNWC
jgi:hypothetical protein